MQRALTKRSVLFCWLTCAGYFPKCGKVTRFLRYTLLCKHISDMRFNKDAIIYCMVQGIGALLILWLCLHLVGCKTIQQQTAVHNRDSVRVEVRLDSIYIYEHDSIWRDRWRQGDTVFVTVEKWKTRYRDKLREVHDTIAVVKTDSVTTVVTVPRPRTGYDRFCSWFFWIVVVLLLLLGGFWICDKIPACKPYTTAIKLFLRI